MTTLTTNTRSSRGQALVEYTLILGFIALTAFVVLGQIGTDIVAVLNKVAAGF